MTMRLLRACVAACMLALASPVLAVQPGEMLDDPALEARARELSRELRCMVCQNQSIDDSDAPLARDLRVLVRERIKAGDSNRQVLDFLTVRYGEFVLLKPRMSWRNALLWLAPAGILAAGAVGLLLALRRRRALPDAPEPGAPALSADERRRLDELLRGSVAGPEKRN